MAPWSPNVIKRFSTVPVNTNENDFYGPYNKLLCTLFPADSNYTISPQAYPLATFREPVDFSVEYDANPVFILEIRDPKDLSVPSARQEADDQIRRRMVDLAESCPIPIFHAVSAFGTCLSFYALDKTAPVPLVAHAKSHATNIPPPNRWDCDILEEKGGNRFKAVIEAVKVACGRIERRVG